MGHKIGSSLKGGETLALTGELGSGKTTFVQGLAKGLGITRAVLSPTFILVRKYDVPINHGPSVIKHFYHVDLYRLEGAVETEVKNLGVDEAWGKKKNIVVIEWADKLTGLLPAGTIRIEFENLGGDKRKVTVS